MKIILGLALGLLIGAGTRYFDLPVPAPPKLVGALLVVAMTLGYMGMDQFLAKNQPENVATFRDHCGGPTGDTALDGEKS